jgi:hypothetical protein
MDRRSFFSLVGIAPLAGCVGRDEPGPPAEGDAFAPELAKFRRYIVPEGIDPALAFSPLRQPKP